MKRVRLTESQLNRVILNTAKRLVKESQAKRQKKVVSLNENQLHNLVLRTAKRLVREGFDDDAFLNDDDMSLNGADLGLSYIDDTDDLDDLGDDECEDGHCLNDSEDEDSYHMKF